MFTGIVICKLYNLPYSRKYWWGHKFGSLAVGEATVKLKIHQYFVHTNIHMAIPYRTAKFKSANIFVSVAQDQTTKFKDCQYFRLYGILYSKYSRLHSHVKHHIFMYLSFATRNPSFSFLFSASAAPLDSVGSWASSSVSLAVLAFSSSTSVQCLPAAHSARCSADGLG